MKKRLFALIAAVSLMFTACATADPDASSSAPEGTSSGTAEGTKDPIVLQIGVEPSYVDYYTEMGEAYTAENPHVTFEIVGTGMFDILNSLEAQKGNSADIFMLPNDRVGDLAQKRLIAPITADISSYSKPSQGAAEFEGEKYFVPLTTDTTLLYYNKSLVEEVPTTLSEIDPADWSAKYTDFYIAAGMLANHGAYIFGDDNTDIGLNSPEAVAGLKVIQDLFHNGSENWVAMQEDTSGYDYQVQAFIDGSIKYYIDGPWKFTDLVSGGLAEENIGFIPVPSWDGEGTYAPLSGVKGVAVNAYSKNVEEAQKFLETLATAENAQKWYDAHNEVNPHQDVVFEEGSIAEVVAQATSVGTPMPTDPAFGKVWVPMADALKQVAADPSVDPQAVLDAAVATIEADIAAMG